MTVAKFKITASEVLRQNVVMLALLALFPFCAGVRITNGRLSPYTNWPLLAIYAVLLPGLYFSIRLIVAVLQDSADDKSDRAGNVAFGGSIGWRMFFVTAAVFPIAVSILSYRQDGQITPAEVLFPFVMNVLVFYCWPRTIEFSGGALVQKTLLGGARSISLSDIAGARFDARQRSIIITSKSGVRVVHSMFHSRQAQFARRLAELAGVRVFETGQA